MKGQLQEHILRTYCVHNSRLLSALHSRMTENNRTEHLYCTPQPGCFARTDKHRGTY